MTDVYKRQGELIDLAVRFEIIQKSGSWFSYKDNRLCQGRDKLKEYLRENKALAAEIEALVREEFQKQTAAARAPKEAVSYTHLHREARFVRPPRRRRRRFCGGSGRCP